MPPMPRLQRLISESLHVIREARAPGGTAHEAVRPPRAGGPDLQALARPGELEGERPASRELRRSLRRVAPCLAWGA
jgi:hypothetical protein